MFKVRAIDVEQVIGNASADWIWAINVEQEFAALGIDSFFHGGKVGAAKAVQRFDEIVESRRSAGPGSEAEDCEFEGDILQVVRVEPSCERVHQEVCLVTKINPDFEDYFDNMMDDEVREYVKINPDFEDYFDNMMDDEVREYVKDWSPRIEGRVQLVKVPIQREPLPDRHFKSPLALTWSNEMKNSNAKYEIQGVCSVDDKTEILASLENYISENRESDD